MFLPFSFLLNFLPGSVVEGREKRLGDSNKETERKIRGIN
jgi:hypothetical protein